MDVQCERCKTEYEFDDALVSGRGTTVRCTNCGHQFKVRGESSGAAAPGADKWVVTSPGGNRQTFLSLRELQRAILAKQVARADVLARGSAAPRTLGSIAELEPFFEGRPSSRPPPAGAGVSAPPRLPGPPAVPRPDAPATFPKRAPSLGSQNKGASAAANSAPTAALPPVGPPRRTEPFGPLPDAASAPRKVETLRPPPVAPAMPPPPTPTTQVMQPVRAVSREPTPAAPPATQLMPRAQTPAPTPPPQPAPAPARITPPPPVIAMAPEVSSPLPPPTVPVRRAVPTYDEESELRGALPSSADEPYGVPRRRRVGGWIVALVLLGAVGLVGWIVAKPYLQARSAGEKAQLDPRAQQFLTDGERAMGEGDLDGAQAAFDKASALAERDARVLLDEARVAAAKADVPWLKIKLLPADAANELRTTKAQLDERTAIARRAADDAMSAAPDDASAARAKLDALRIAGERDAARALVSKVVAQSTQNETAYALAALDLAEPEPLWATVLERLRVAAASEGNAGRARAALVYALARSGDVATAKAELAKLDVMARPYPLLPNLHAYVDKAPARPLASASVAAAAGSVPLVAVGSLPQALPPGAGAGDTPGGGDVPADSRSAMAQAQAAIKKGDWSHAREIYEGMAARNPNDSEALAGIGDCARAQGDTAGAIAAYKRALAVNPSYLPALLGMADTMWAGGDKSGAMRVYKEIVDRFPEGSYPSYVKTRTEGGGPPPPASATATATATASAPPKPKPAATDDELGP